MWGQVSGKLVEGDKLRIVILFQVRQIFLPFFAIFRNVAKRMSYSFVDSALKLPYINASVY